VGRGRSSQVLFETPHLRGGTTFVPIGLSVAYVPTDSPTNRTWIALQAKTRLALAVVVGRFCIMRESLTCSNHVE